MFVMRAAQFLDELKRYEPGICAACTQSVARAPAGAGACAGAGAGHHVALARASLEGCISKSVDHAVFERSERVGRVSLGSAWTSLGSWAAVAELDKRAAHCAADASQRINIDAEHHYVRADKMVALIGVSVLPAVDTPDALPIRRRTRAQEVKDVVAALDAQKSTLTQYHGATAADSMTLQSPRRTTLCTAHRGAAAYALAVASAGAACPALDCADRPSQHHAGRAAA